MIELADGTWAYCVHDLTKELGFSCTEHTSKLNGLGLGPDLFIKMAAPGLSSHRCYKLWSPKRYEIVVAEYRARQQAVFSGKRRFLSAEERERRMAACQLKLSWADRAALLGLRKHTLQSWAYRSGAAYVSPRHPFHDRLNPSEPTTRSVQQRGLRGAVLHLGEGIIRAIGLKPGDTARITLSANNKVLAVTKED